MGSPALDKATALLVIDYTNDFVAPGGRLTCGEPGQAIDAALAAVIACALDSGAHVFACNDVHDENDRLHPESALFPPHNLRGTSGRELYGKTGELLRAAQEGGRAVFLDKTRYSAFAGTNLDILLREREVKTVALTGVCTDICVLHSAVSAYNLGYGIRVYRSAVASFNPGAHEFALMHIQNTLGGVLV